MGYNTGVGIRTAVVTGASSLKGIGYHTALRFAQEGWAVAMIDLNAEGLEQAAMDDRSAALFLAHRRMTRATTTRRSA